jgi:type I restriction enzyme S subunit
MNAIEGWKTEQLGAVIKDIGDGGTPNTNKKEYFGGSIPWVVIQDIRKDISTTKTTLTPLGLKSCSAKLWPAGSVILSTGATIGEVGLAEVPVATKQGIHGIVCKEELSSHYLYYKLQTLRGFLNANAQGSTIREVRATFLRTIPFLFPISKSEQTKIAEILSTVDRAIEQTEALIAKQQRIKTGLMQDLLTRGIDEHGNLRIEQTHKFKDSPLGRIPVEWEVRRLGESCVICNNLRKPIAALVRETMKGEYPYYGPTGILDYIDECRVDGKFVLIGEDGDHFLKYKTQEMTLLVDGKFNVNNHAHILQGENDVLTEWLHLYFLHRDITLHLTRQGAGRFKLNKAALTELPLIAPKDQSEQDRILRVMNTLRKNQIISTTNLYKLKLKKTALMQDLLTGKKRVTRLLVTESKNRKNQEEH